MIRCEPVAEERLPLSNTLILSTSPGRRDIQFVRILPSFGLKPISHTGRFRHLMAVQALLAAPKHPCLIALQKILETMTLAEKMQPTIDKLLAHPLYDHVQTVSRLRIFMQEHAFAVWDFMTLLKNLQNRFCGTTPPWTPPQHPSLARFVNEIVLGEETDTDLDGGFTSHFELSLRHG